MNDTLIPIHFQKIMQTRAYTVIVIGTKEKRFAIYTEPSIGRLLQIHLSQVPKPRPFTHDLIGSMLRGFSITIKQVVISEFSDNTFFARIFLEQKDNKVTHIVEVDGRPSDCLSLALLHQAPIFCVKKVLDEAIPLEE